MKELVSGEKEWFSRISRNFLVSEKKFVYSNSNELINVCIKKLNHIFMNANEYVNYIAKLTWYVNKFNFK